MFLSLSCIFKLKLIFNARMDLVICLPVDLQQKTIQSIDDDTMKTLIISLVLSMFEEEAKEKITVIVKENLSFEVEKIVNNETLPLILSLQQGIILFKKNFLLFIVIAIQSGL